jgi:nucleotide-binding universal stress UspA family protein
LILLQKRELIRCRAPFTLS